LVSPSVLSQASLARADDGLCAVGHLEFAQDVGDVIAHRFGAQHEAGGDLGVLMALRAGFDFVSEVTNATLLKLIKTLLAIQSSSANPPFELTLPLSVVNGNMHVIVEELVIDLLDDDTVVLTLSFDNTSVIASSPAFTLATLAGTLTIKAPVVLTTIVPTVSAPSFDFPNAVVSVTYSTPDNKISAGLKGTGVTVQTFKQQTQQAVTTFIQSMGLQTFSTVAFSAVPGANGSLQPLIFERLEVHCIGNADRAMQALGFFVAWRISHPAVLSPGRHEDGQGGLQSVCQLRVRC
jgi:hypothetical protein